MALRNHFVGVNLGGWLVLEKWLTESLFEGTGAHDEWTFMRTKGAKSRIERHRRTFITESDFAWLRNHGVKWVRIPVGYWAFRAQDGYIPSVVYLDFAMKMAEKYDLQVLIDLHGAPGSQNGGDHSGRRGEVEWFTSENQAATIEILKEIALRYRDSSALWGIELLNEPRVRGRYLTLLRFYRRAYAELRPILRPGTYTVFHDGFRPLLFTGALCPRRHYPVALDIHLYAFSIKGTHNVDRYLRQVRRWRRLQLWLLQLFQPVIIGEWSTVLPQQLFDAAPRGQHDSMMRKNALAQQEAYAQARGHAYWNYKAEGRGMWNFRALVEDGIISID